MWKYGRILVSWLPSWFCHLLHCLRSLAPSSLKCWNLLNLGTKNISCFCWPILISVFPSKRLPQIWSSDWISWTKNKLSSKLISDLNAKKTTSKYLYWDSIFLRWRLTSWNYVFRNWKYALGFYVNTFDGVCRIAFIKTVASLSLKSRKISSKSVFSLAIRMLNKYYILLHSIQRYHHE